MPRWLSGCLALLLLALWPNMGRAAGALVTAFGEACLPERLSFGKSLAHARKIGWQAVSASDDRELENVMARALAEAKDPENPDWKIEYGIFARNFGDRRFHLVITRLGAPDVITLIGCHVYDFAATQPVDPAEVSALLNHKLAYSTLDKSGQAYADPATLVSHAWGPPPSLPRQFDTYLTFIPEGSPMVAKTGFSGIVLKSSASEPKQTDTQ